jgi:hypothetical protein
VFLALSALDSVVDDGGECGGQHHLAVGERAFDAPLQHEHARGDPAAQDGNGQQRRVFLLAQAADVLEVSIPLAHGDRDGAHALRSEAGDPLAGAKVHSADRLPRKADVSAHREADVVVDLFAHVDAGDVRARDVGDVRAHGGQHLLERAVFVTERDQPEDSIERAVARAMDLEAEGAAVRRRHAYQHKAITVSGAFPT